MFASWFSSVFCGFFLIQVHSVIRGSLTCVSRPKHLSENSCSIHSKSILSDYDRQMTPPLIIDLPFCRRNTSWLHTFRGLFFVSSVHLFHFLSMLAPMFPPQTSISFNLHISNPSWSINPFRFSLRSPFHWIPFPHSRSPLVPHDPMVVKF